MKPSVLILAGGESRRMGRDKAWIEYHGQPLIRRALDTVRALDPAEVFISGRPDGDYTSLGCTVLFDLEPGLGPLGDIERGLHHCATPLLLVIPVDLPQLNPSVLAALLARCDTHTGAAPRLGTQIEPLVAVYPKRCHGFAFDRILHGSRAAHAFAEDCRHEGALHLWNVPALHSPCFANWNQPGDITSAPPTPHTPTSDRQPLPLVYACSGASSAAQMANHLAVRLDRQRAADMSCIAGLGGDVAPLVRTAKSGRPIIAIDGCPLHCVAKTLARHHLTASQHLDLSRFGVAKRTHHDFDPAEASRVLDALIKESRTLLASSPKPN